MPPRARRATDAESALLAVHLRIEVLDFLLLVLDLLFLDLKLPDGPADDVYDVAKETDPNLPIVVITGYPDSEMLDRILAKGPVTVLKKPLKVEQLQQTVRILGHEGAAKLAA